MGSGEHRTRCFQADIGRLPHGQDWAKTLHVLHETPETDGAHVKVAEALRKLSIFKAPATNPRAKLRQVKGAVRMGLPPWRPSGCGLPCPSRPSAARARGVLAGMVCEQNLRKNAATRP